MRLDYLVRDLRYGWRGLWQSRMFAATTVATLAVGLALVTVVFTIFNAYVLRPFAVRDPFSLHYLAWMSRDAGGRFFAWEDVRQVSERRDLFDAVIAERTRYVAGERGPITAAFVSGNYFDTLAPRLRLGRSIAEFDARTPGSNPVAVLSHDAWVRLFDRDPSVLGRSLTLNGEPFVVIGVAHEEFAGLDDSPRDAWVPVTMYPAVMKQDLFGPARVRNLGITVRLRPDVTAAHAQASLTPYVASTRDRTDDVRAELRSQATPAPLSLDLLAILSPVFVAFGLVLAAACANVSNIMLARANTRHREIAVRLSLGASRGRVVAQLLTEGALIAMLAGLAGLGLAALLLRLGTTLLFVMLPPTAAALVRVVPLVFDGRVFLFTMAVGAVATMMFALVPALQATRLTLTHALKGEPSQAMRRSALRSSLVTAQVAISLLLLIAAGTLVRNGVTIGATDLGFETDGVVSVNQRARGTSLIGNAATALGDDARIAAVAVTSRNPLFGQLPKAPANAQPNPAVVAASYMYVSPEYFDLLGIPIAQGRGFRPEEAKSEASVAIVSAATARALWPGQDPLGQTLGLRLDPFAGRAEEIAKLQGSNMPKPVDPDTGQDLTVIGVANDVVSGFIFEGTDRAHVYMPTHDLGTHAGAILLRGRGSRTLRIDEVQAALRPVHDDPLAFESMPLGEAVAMQMFPIVMASWIGSLLSGIALVLSVSGLYGVVSYGLNQRTREIGIRMALGATAAAVVRLVMAQSARLVGIGTVVGTCLAFAALAVLRSIVRLDNVTIVDGAVFAAAAAIVAIAAAFASFVPARRAASIEPAATLRADG